MQFVFFLGFFLLEKRKERVASGYVSLVGVWGLFKGL